LRRVTARADRSATVEDITGLEDSVQDALLFEQRASPTTGNLIARLTSAGELTESVAQALHDMPRPTMDDENENLSVLANQAVEASQKYLELLTADIISDFVTGAGAQIHLEPNSVLKAEDSVAILLIDEGRVEVVATRKAAATATPAIAWEVREALLAKVPTPDANELASLVQAEDARAFLTSDRISDEVRALTPKLLDTLLTGVHRTPNANTIAEYLISRLVLTTLKEVLQLADAGGKRSLILELLLREPTKTDFSTDPVAQLRVLGGDYAALVDRAVKQSPTFHADATHQKFLEHLARLGVISNPSSGPTGRLRVRRLYPSI
jgi:hypothetical protein